MTYSYDKPHLATHLTQPSTACRPLPRGLYLVMCAAIKSNNWDSALSCGWLFGVCWLVFGQQRKCELKNFAAAAAEQAKITQKKAKKKWKS